MLHAPLSATHSFSSIGFHVFALTLQTVTTLDEHLTNKHEESNLRRNMQLSTINKTLDTEKSSDLADFLDSLQNIRSVIPPPECHQQIGRSFRCVLDEKRGSRLLSLPYHFELGPEEVNIRTYLLKRVTNVSKNFLLEFAYIPTSSCVR